MPRVIVSLTSIPSRFDKLGPILTALSEQTCHEVWLNIPKAYNRFPDWDGKVPAEILALPKVKVNMGCEDFGPGTKFIAAAQGLDAEDIIVYVDDDTAYDSMLVKNLLSWHRVDPKAAWGLSGFEFENYFNGRFPRQHGALVDVLEGYGGVIVKAGWIQKILPEFKELLEVTWHDDMILCNLLAKAGIERKTVFTPECNLVHVTQFNYGFGADALHHIAGDGGHVANNKKILRDFEVMGKLYY